ncbi:GNAT family N-acetyltransferase, partial [Haloferax profundi]|uniref:GNAT family N-acetyltransferase n=1 Tax=Haloferax profundi TaxID=1544718 RepID=UPI000B2E86DF
EGEARRHGFDSLFLHGQTSAEGFYHGLDYETTSDVFDEAGIPHVEMEKNL